MLLVFRHLHASFGRPDDVCILKSVGEVVDEQVLHHAGFSVLLFHIDVVSVDVAIEHTFGDVEFRRCLLHGYEQGPELQLCLWGNHILEIEGDSAQHHAEDDERTDDTEQRDTGCFHGKKLEFLAEVTEGHQCGQQDGERERDWNQGQRRVEEKLG